MRESRLLYGETLSFAGIEVTDIELYDLAIDPFQRKSLHEDPSLRREAERPSLKRHLELLKGCGGGTCQLLEQ